MASPNTYPHCHPGTYIRESVIPAGMSVTEAAKRLGVGRPALSNLLNGNSALSAEMAARLEKAFGADRQKLLEMQAIQNRQDRHAEEKEIAVRAFVPNFLTIKAKQIENWADGSIEARTHLPVLLRKLVHSTGCEPRRVDFPGYDNAQRKGSDGFVDAGTATPWVPEGRSYWEFGTDQKVSAKAEADYAARLASVDPDERASGTFVFVTPRNWPGKVAWEKLKNEAGDWKAVRVFDASDLEQWLEQSVTAQIWLAEQLGLPTGGYETLEQAWLRWANVSDPRLTPELFAPSIAAHREGFEKWLNKPSDRPFVIAADSHDEALAFLASLFDDEALRGFRDRVAIFTDPAPFKKLVGSSADFIPIVYTDQAERELADAHRRLHCVVYRPRNAVDTRADIALDLLSMDAFRKALEAMGVADDEVERLERESGRSPTILRRRLSNNVAIRVPAWAGDAGTAKVLIPMAMIGAWHAETAADRKVLSSMADRTHESIEDDIARLLRFEDSPVWSVGRYRGVASKIDALFAIAGMVTPADIDRFFTVAGVVLSERDPALDLPEKDRWAAALYDKKREHSDALREGICETLVILSVHGNDLFQDRLGIDVGARVAALIRKLLTPLTLEKLLSHDRNLPLYAEAAPDEFLRIFEEDLRRNDPIVYGLLAPVDSSSFGMSPTRTGLLWALECLAWKPQSLSRVSMVLARLSQKKIVDNWTNKPIASLLSIFRSWMPQTAADVDQRVKALETVAKRFPEIAWEVAIEQLKPGPRTGFYSRKPRWRSDASGAGHVVTRKELYEFNKKALDLLIAWPSHDEKTLGELVDTMRGLPEEIQTKIWDLIDVWAKTADEASKAVLRERIRRFAFTRRSRHRELGQELRDRARRVYDDLEPRDPIVRHGWLFAEQWVQESLEVSDSEAYDHRKRDERIDRLRREAMGEIWTECGMAGVERLLLSSRAAGTVGRYVASCVHDVETQATFILWCLALEGELHDKADWCLQQFLLNVQEESRNEVLEAAAASLSADERVRLFACAPFQTPTWQLLERYGDGVHDGYWKEVNPSWWRHAPAELNEIVDRLLEARRPRAAFHAVHMDFNEIETSRLKRLLRDVATVDAEPTGHYQIDSYYISDALKSLDGRAGVTRDEMAQLEFFFIGALQDSEHGIPNLERQLAESSMLFFQAVSYVYKRDDDGEDSFEWRIEDPEKRASVALAAHNMLEQVKRIPGTGDGGEIDAEVLAAWLIEVRRLCHEHARSVVGDHCLGQLLAKAPEGKDGMWPCEAVCEALEGIASPDIADGFSIGVYNSRGAHWRGEGGAQERELAEKYRVLAQRLHFEYPYMGGILEDVADSYEREAKRHDSDARVRTRLHG